MDEDGWDDPSDFDDDDEALERWTEQFGLPDVPEEEAEIGDLSRTDFTGMQEQDQAALMAARVRELNEQDADAQTGIPLDGEFDFRKAGERDRFDALRVSGYDVSDATVSTTTTRTASKPAFFLQCQAEGWGA